MLSLTICGTRFQIGWPFLILLIIYALLGMGFEATIAFLSVAAHEAAHALVAGAYDIEIECIEILPFGGVARLDGPLELDPHAETSVALAGPASSFLLAGAASMLWRLGMLSGSASFLIDFNILLGLVNLIPVLPMDGGRVARACLSSRVGHRAATTTITRLGKWLSAAAFLSGVGLLTTGRFIPNLLIYSTFGYVYASVESERAAIASVALLLRRKERLAREGVIATQNLTALSSVSLDRVARAFLPRRYVTVTVLDDKHRPLGMVTESDIVEAILSGHGRAPLIDLLKNPLH